MAKISARNVKVVMSGRDVSGHSNNATITRSAEAPEVTSFGDNDRTRLAAGLKDYEMTLDGFIDTSASSTDEFFSSNLNASTLVAFIPEGWAACKVAHSFAGIISSYDQTYAVEDAAGFSVTVAGSTLYTRGKSLGYFSAVSGSSSGCTIDFGAAQSSPHVFLHILSLGTGCSRISACLRGSSDDGGTDPYATAIDITSTGNGWLTYAGQAITASVASIERYMDLRYAASGGTATFLATVGMPQA